MNAHSNVRSMHPHAAAIPDARTEGVRAYREPAEPNPLQLTFVEEAGERAWIEEMRDLLSNGRADDASERLEADLAPFDGALARLCKATPAEAVTLEGFEDLLPILEEWEGPAITGITVGLTNPTDLVFEAGRTHQPELLIGLYSDESFPFSSAGKADLVAECARDFPAWMGAEEDVEFHCTIPGLAELNTALIHSKHRRYLRDGRDGIEGRAPGGYVEFVLGSWLLAIRFLQATQRAVKEYGLPPSCQLVAGTIDIHADFVCVLSAERRRRARSNSASTAAQPGFATLTVKPWVRGEEPVAEQPATAPTLRQRVLSEEPATQPRAGLLARLFGRFSRR